MKLFNFSQLNLIKSADIKEAFAMDNMHEVLILSSENNPFYLKLSMFDTEAGNRCTVQFMNADSDECLIEKPLSYTTLKNLKDQLKTLISNWNDTPPTKKEKATEDHETANPMDKFLSLPIGQPFACDLNNGAHVNEAIKSGDETITFNHYGKMKTILFVPGMTCDPEWPIIPDYKLIQDPYNKCKQYILKRENFQEITVFQLVHGHQVSRAKFTESELLTTYDFIYEYQLNRLLSSNCNSAARLYKIKHSFLSGKSKNWRADAKLSCANPSSLNFSTFVAREQKLKPLIARVEEAMKKTCPGRGVKCWWCIPSINNVLLEGQSAGLIHRISTTQVAWTNEGVTKLTEAKQVA